MVKSKEGKKETEELSDADQSHRLLIWCYWNSWVMHCILICNAQTARRGRLNLSFYKVNVMENGLEKSKNVTKNVKKDKLIFLD